MPASHPSSGLRLLLEHTWDGQPLPACEHTVLILEPAPGALRLRGEAPFAADPPPAAPAGSTPGLWNHEVVELFIAGAATPETYTEVELGPHGHYLVLRLEGRRQVQEEGLALDFQAQVQGPRWTGTALLPHSYLPPAPHRLNAYAIRGTGRGRCYLAWQPVPGPAPDFHQPDRFAPISLPGWPLS